MIKTTLLRILGVLAACALLFLALLASQQGFEQVLQFRTLERIPLTTVAASTDGEVQLRGQVIAGANTLKAPRSGADAVYYRYLVEEETRDSDGDTSWRTITDETRWLPFTLRDQSAQVMLDTSSDTLEWSADVKYRDRVGDRRYREWRIDVGDTVTVFGWLNRANGRWWISFPASDQYLPIISSFGELSERESRGWSATLWMSGGITLLVAACFVAMYVLRQHRVLRFLAAVSIATLMLLGQYGWRSLENDVRAGFDRVERQRERAASLIGQTIGRPDNEDAFAFDLLQPQFATLQPQQREQLNGWRLLAWQTRERYLEQIGHFPESWYARINRLDSPTAIWLPPDQQALADASRADFQRTALGNGVVPALVAIGLTLLAAWLSFRFIRTKRMQENLPSCSTGGVSYGITELVGTLEPETPDALLTGPLSNRHCSWFRYLVKERRGSGKKSRWVTIEDRSESRTFYCRDNEGRIRVDCDGADIISGSKDTERNGNRRYYEWRLEPGDELYLLGSAVIDETTGDRLQISRADHPIYIISNLSEQQVMLRKATSGLALLGAAAALLFSALIMIAGTGGGFSSLDYLLAGLGAPLFFVTVMAIILYNDLVFLRERARRAWSNIQVSLRKRADLVPALEGVVRALGNHERNLQEQLAQWRSQDKAQLQQQQVAGLIDQEKALLSSMDVAVEAYPQLVSDEAYRDFSSRLIALENEIALMRAGYNDAVELYNTRRRQFPDLLFAKLGRMQALTFI